MLFESSPVPDGDGTQAEADVFTVRFDGTGAKALSARPGVRETDPVVSPDGALMAWRAGQGDSGTLLFAPLSPAKVLGAAKALEVSAWRTLDDSGAKAGAQAPKSTRALSTVEVSGVPYIHQVYDTPDNFNGHWACGPTSAMMTVAFRGILANWDTTCSSPSSHTSHWGNYISKVYTKGRKFDIAADTATGVGYGAYGYIRQPTGYDTKGHMAEFLRYHDLDSSVDWSPTWGELQAEVDKKQPFVILTSITSSGHYKVIIGYATAQHTMVLNDPYGDKNRGYMNYYGKRVFYDWPGYSNGFANVKAVACFVYSRATSTPTPTTGTLKGTVYKAPTTTAYISGATVTAGGKSATTNASGAFSLTLPAGTYDLVVKATGYQDGKVSKSVTAGGTTTAAVGLYPAVATGDFKGVVYEVNPADPADKTKRLTGAEVSLDNGAFKAVRASDAYFVFNTAPGPHTVKARLAGYVDNTSSATVVANAEIWASVGLSKTATAAAPKLHLSSPEEGEFLDDTTFDVTGTVENAGGVSEVQVTAAGTIFKGPLTGGGFAVKVTVPVGKTMLQVKAANSAGSDTQTRTVNFKTGLCGIVSDEAGPLAGASAALLPVDDACGLPLATATTGPDGRYCLDAAEGSYVLKVVAGGHLTALESIEVGTSARETVETAMLTGSDPAPSLELVSPAVGEDGKAHVAEPTVTLSYRTAGITPVTTRVNGQEVTPTEGDQEGDTVQVIGGLPLQPGENVFEVQVSGQCGASASATITVVREDEPAGGTDAGQPVSGADAGSSFRLGRRHGPGRRGARRRLWLRERGRDGGAVGRGPAGARRAGTQASGWLIGNPLLIVR
ncbi:MAG: carboxypeptidase regulatory-like domain-containing protein [Myxococcales bacterium]